MKRSTCYLILSIFICTFFSCKRDGFLTRSPLSSIVPDNFFNSENDFQLYCNQYYPLLPAQTFGLADDQSDDDANQNINQFLEGTTVIPQSASNLPWGSDYINIRTYNFFLASYPKAPVSDSIKNIYVGESLFFRVLAYWDLVKKYDNVPYVDKYITDTSTSVLYGQKMPHKQVMDSLLSDLNFVVAHVPAAPLNGRIGMYQALALKARVCLWEGTYRKYFGLGDETPYLQAASAAAEQIMGSGNYHIYSTGNPGSDYYNLFIQTNLGNNPEAIMPMIYSGSVNFFNNVDRGLGENGYGYSKDFVRSYLCTDGLPTSVSPLYKGDDSLDEEIVNRDPRLKQSIATRGFNYLNGDTISLPRLGNSVTASGYLPIKGRSGDVSAYQANNSVYNFFIFRYAETLLIEAEATAELETCTQTTIDNTINLLRDRVGMPHMIINNLVRDPKSHFPDVSVLIDEIRRERRIELASEGFRFDDLHRWKAGTLINNPETVLGVKLLPSVRAEYTYNIGDIVTDPNYYIEVYPGAPARVWDDKLYLNAIPIQELTLNPNLKPQNPGWE